MAERMRQGPPRLSRDALYELVGRALVDGATRWAAHGASLSLLCAPVSAWMLWGCPRDGCLVDDRVGREDGDVGRVVLEVETLAAQGAREVFQAQGVYDLVGPSGRAGALLDAQEDAVFLALRVIFQITQFEDQRAQVVVVVRALALAFAYYLVWARKASMRAWRSSGDGARPVRHRGRWCSRSR
jgi:hypothetical protein